ncbi:TBC1 domain family member 10A [Nerophis lumbriciformis]|uniref:TBC1 domain family member 10A n=1 Tax=Nerophis lumbriciformis TaxID=546530 RepID=UPI003BA9FC05
MRHCQWEMAAEREGEAKAQASKRKSVIVHRQRTCKKIIALKRNNQGLVLISSEMLSPSRPGPGMCSEEDGRGSEPGSEVGSGLETDRFGFIVSDGSEARRTEGPRPQLVRQREAKWINVMDQWESILFKKNNMVKVQCQKGIPSSLRAKCWPLLCGATNRMNNNKHLYQCLDSKAALQKWVDVIERDLDRQFPFHEMFLSKEGHGQQGLFRVLKAFTQYKPEDGYCQAQGPVAAVLLMNMPAEEAFWCLVQISERYLPGYYSPLLEGVLFDATLLTWLLRRTCPPAHKHLQQHGVEPLMFATDWLMCLFTRHLPFNALLRVWDLFFCNGAGVLLQVAVVLVRRVLGRAEQRRECQGQMETLQRLRNVRCEVQEVEDDFIAEVCAIPLSASDLGRHTEKELAKWRKDRPSSTLDPRGRCQGYRMAWAQLNREREPENFFVPLTRSASSLLLSTSRWKKGGHAGGKVARHLSMQAKDWRSCNELNFEEDTGGSHAHRLGSMAKREMAEIQVEKMQSAKNSEFPTIREDGSSSKGGVDEESSAGLHVQALTQTQQQLATDHPLCTDLCETNTLVECIHQQGGIKSEQKEANKETTAIEVCKETASPAQERKSSGELATSFSGDVCIPESSSLTRRLSKDLFIDPAHTLTDSPTPAVPHSEAAKRKQPRKSKQKVESGLQVPTILVQDFSDQLVEEGRRLEKRRWWRRHQQDRKDKKEREKKEKEGERRKPQTRGESFQVQRETMKSYFTSAESYF